MGAGAILRVVWGDVTPPECRRSIRMVGNYGIIILKIGKTTVRILRIKNCAILNLLRIRNKRQKKYLIGSASK